MLASLLGLALALGAAPHGEPEVSWQAPEGCSDATAVRRRIEGLLRRPLASGEVSVEGVVLHEGSGFVLRLRVHAGEVIDERALRAERCGSLVDTAALVAAVMIDPAVADTLLVPEPDPPPSGTEEPTPAGDASGGGTTNEASTVNDSGAGMNADAGAGTNDDARPQASTTADRIAPADPSRAGDRPEGSRAAGLWLRARAGGEFGAVPSGTGGAAVGLGFGGPRLRAELEGQYWIGRLAESPHAAARIHLGHVAARACGVLPRRPLTAAVCAGFELGAMRADALEPDRITRHRPWLAAQVEVALRWQPWPRVALWIGAQPFVPIVFPRFELVDPAASDTRETIHAPSPVGIRGLAGIELRISSARAAAPR